MKKEIKEIPFNDNTLLGVKTEDSKIWLAVRKTCRDIGLTDAQGQAETKKIQESLLFDGNWVKFDPVQTEGNRNVKRAMIFISEKFVPLWLAQINLTPAMQKKNPEAVKKLLTYQLEAADVLHQAFYETEEQKEQFHERFDLQGEIVDMKETLKIQTIQINSMETIIERQSEKMESLIDNMTLSTRQQEKILRAGRERVNLLLGGAHSTEYKKKARTYLANLWNNLKADLHCGSSYKDLNPKDFNIALDYIGSWEYND